MDERVFLWDGRTDMHDDHYYAPGQCRNCGESRRLGIRKGVLKEKVTEALECPVCGCATVWPVR